MQSIHPRQRLAGIAGLAIVAVLAGVFAWSVPRADAQAATMSTMSHAQLTTATRTTTKQALHDTMRKLWEDHVTWTRLAIVTFASGPEASFQASAARLLANQQDIGDAIKPFYGDAAGTQLTALLTDHITIAVELMQAVRNGDTAAFTDAHDRWYANGNDIADFLAAANPKYWPQDMMRADMKTHLDQTLAEAGHELSGDFAASVADYEPIHAHILNMADMLSDGLIGAFPSMVR